MLKTEFNHSWKFAVSGQPFQPVSIPHDAMMLEPRKEENPSGTGCAFFGGGCYEYEKEFVLPDCKSAVLHFEGAYPMAEIMLDGEKAASIAYGYGDCFVDCSRFADGKPHTVHVTVDNTGVPNSRWYSGAGLYRPVWLYSGPEAYILPEGIKIKTVSLNPAVIQVETAHDGGEVSIEILDGSRVVAAGNGDRVTLEIPEARLWDADHPNLYTCRAVLTGGDTAECRFGIRMVTWSHDGLFINGSPVKLRGGCIHHDNGIIGSRSYAYSEYRRVKKMKDFGFNAIRSAHNPICRSLLEACDELGMYVMDESWDMWYDKKTDKDYSSRFRANWEKDLEAMVAKDYSHPSVILYSIGNEVTEPFAEEGIRMTGQLVSRFHELDNTRAVTAGINPTLIQMRAIGFNAFDGSSQEDKPVNSTDFNKKISESCNQMIAGAATEAVDKISSPCLDQLDIAGYNYATSRYELDAVVHPDRILVGSETFPQDLPVNWDLVEKLPYLVGDFMWTAWDYIGEVGLGAWTYSAEDMGFVKHYPWLLADAGAFDILGNDTAEAGMASIIWRQRTKPYIGVRPVNQNADNLYLAMWRGTNARPSWSWRGCDGKMAVVEVYSRDAEAELLLNGVSLGRKKIGAQYRADFSVAYAPGTLTAVGYDSEGKKTGECSLHSAEGAMSVRVQQENEAICGQPVYLNVDIVGENGIVEHNYDRTLTVQVQGAKLLGFGSANPRTEERFETGVYTTYYGRSLAVLLAESSEIQLTVTADDFAPVTVNIPVQEVSKQ